MPPERARLLALPGLALLLVYGLTASRAVLGGDNGEFATLYIDGGVAHPPGFPLFALYLRAMRWLPSASPAHGAALATALLGGASVGVWALAAWRLGASVSAAAFSAALYGASSLAWRLATHGEVFTLNALLAGTLVCAATPSPRGEPIGSGPTGSSRVALVGLLSGLGAGGHTSFVLLAPMALYGFAVGLRESPRRGRSALLGVTGLLVGLSSYAWLWREARRPGDSWRWGDTSTLTGIVHHALRVDYGTTSLRANGGESQPLSHLASLLAHLGAEAMVLPALCALGALCALCTPWVPSLRARVAGETPRGSFHALGASLALAGPVFVARFNISLEGVGALIIERFYLLPLALLVPFVAVGVDLASGLPGVTRRVRSVALGALLIGAIARSAPEVIEDHRPTIEQYALDILSLVPPRAVILGTGDHRGFGVLYARRALGVRRDVVYIDPYLLLLPPSRARYERSLGFALPAPANNSVDTVRTASTLLASGRAVFLTDPFTPAIVRAFPTWPIGPLIRVMPPGNPLPSPRELEAMNLDALRRARIRPPTEAPSGWAAYVYDDWARPWLALSAAFRAAGDLPRASLCDRRAALLRGRRAD